KLYLNKEVGAIYSAGSTYQSNTIAQRIELLVAGSVADVVLYRNGEVYVSHPRADVAERIKKQIEAILPRLSNALLSQEVKSRLAARYGQVQEQTAGAALVLTVEV
ncbi:MAG: hypothetical protein C4542_09830, partial [Dehalococcoidia bacterium]